MLLLTIPTSGMPLPDDVATAQPLRLLLMVAVVLDATAVVSRWPPTATVASDAVAVALRLPPTVAAALDAVAVAFRLPLSW